MMILAGFYSTAIFGGVKVNGSWYDSFPRIGQLLARPKFVSIHSLCNAVNRKRLVELFLA